MLAWYSRLCFKSYLPSRSFRVKYKNNFFSCYTCNVAFLNVLSLVLFLASCTANLSVFLFLHCVLSPQTITFMPMTYNISSYFFTCFRLKHNSASAVSSTDIYWSLYSPFSLDLHNKYPLTCYGSLCWQSWFSLWRALNFHWPNVCSIKILLFLYSSTLLYSSFSRL